MTASLKQTIQDQVKTAMRAKDKPRLDTLRLITAGIKQIEIDTQTELDDAGITALLTKMIKQRRDAAKQYQDANRPELAEKEQFEIEIIQEFLPEPLSETEVEQLIKDAIAETGASSMQDMGKVMGSLKAKVQGRADMSAISKQIREQLS